jgi:hypothetical protein
MLNSVKPSCGKAGLVAFAISLSMMTATSAHAEIRKFNKPRHGGHLLDWCLDWGEVGCGKQTASRYCKSRGFKRSVGYKKWEDPGRPTKQISTNSICDANFCDSFQFIMCEK